MKVPEAKIHYKSIASRWFVEVFLIIALAITLVGGILVAVERGIYYDRVESVATNYTREFSALSSATSDTFTKTAISLCENFQYKNKLEVQFFDRNGNVFISTTGFVTSDGDAPDIKTALNSRDGVYTERSSSGDEKVMASSTVIKNGGRVTGGYRWVVSLQKTNERINLLVVLIFAIMILILLLAATSGLFFIKSIVRPIRDVTNIARKISLGDMKTLIKTDRNDEIGELCTTINDMATELQNAENLKNDFISSVSHELRTPLTAIRGWGETAKSSVGSDEELVARGLDVVLSEADRLSGLVEELLDFSRMQQGRLKVTVNPIDVTELLRTVTDMYSELARKQGIEISYTPPQQNSIVMGDKDRLKQVFINIIDNAVKYTPKGGLVLVVQTRAESCVQIQIKDTGVGIPAKDIDHVKEKFYKANNTVRGSGIGLAVADEIMKQHNGLLFIESTEGVGTTATVVLPLYEEPQLPPEMGEILSEQDAQKEGEN